MERRLHHSTELDDFGSFKTAAGPPSEASDAGQHSAPASELCRQGTGLSSTASSGLPGPGARNAASWAGHGGPAAPARPASPALQRSLRLSSDEANLRAASLQEQALVGFLVSGKKDAAAAAQQKQQQQQEQQR